MRTMTFLHQSRSETRCNISFKPPGSGKVSIHNFIPIKKDHVQRMRMFTYRRQSGGRGHGERLSTSFTHGDWPFLQVNHPHFRAVSLHLVATIFLHLPRPGPFSPERSACAQTHPFHTQLSADIYFPDHCSFIVLRGRCVAAVLPC